MNVCTCMCLDNDNPEYCCECMYVFDNDNPEYCCVCMCLTMTILIYFMFSGC